MLPQKNDSTYNTNHIILSNEIYPKGDERLNLDDTYLGSLVYGINSGMNKSDFFLPNGNVQLQTFFKNGTFIKNDTYRRARKTFPNAVNFTLNIEQALYSIMVIQKVLGPSL